MDYWMDCSIKCYMLLHNNIAAHNEMVCVYSNSEQCNKLFYLKTKDNCYSVTYCWFVTQNISFVKILKEYFFPRQKQREDDFVLLSLSPYPPLLHQLL